MIDTDKKLFANETKGLFVALKQQEPDRETLRAWWDKLNQYSMKVVKEAYKNVLEEQAVPTLDNVIKWITVDVGAEHFELKGDDRDWARKIMNKPRHQRVGIAERFAMQVLRMNKND